jgi:hypothetical protein
VVAEVQHTQQEMKQQFETRLAQQQQQLQTVQDQLRALQIKVQQST